MNINRAFKMNSLCYIPQSNCRQFTLYDRVSKLLESFEWSDCSFRVGKEIIRAHKLILAISSPVFKVMLYGPMAEGTEILVSDIEPEVFQLLLDFIYKDKVVIDSLENACGLLYAAKKYMLPYLTEICMKFIEDSITITNVLTVFNFSEWMQEERLISRCLTLICKHANIILGSAFDHISVSCLKIILQQSAINITEKELIRYAFQWANDECLERKITPSDVNKQKILLETGILGSLRFLTLTADDYAWLTATILSEQQLALIKEYLFNATLTKEHVQNTMESEESTQPMNSVFKNETFDNGLSIVNTSVIPRSPLKFDWSYCCRSIIRTAKPLIIDDTFQSVKLNIKCEKTVFLKSFSIPTQQSPDVNLSSESLSSYTEDIKVVISNSSNINDRISANYNNIVDYNSSIYIDLPKPFVLNEREWYNICFSWPGKKSLTLKYPLQIRPANECNCGTIFTFDEGISGCFLEGLKFCI